MCSNYMRMFFENVNLSELLEQLVLKTKIHSSSDGGTGKMSDTAIILSTQHIELYDRVKLIVVVEGDGGGCYCKNAYNDNML